MILTQLVAVSLIVSVSAGPLVEPRSLIHMSAQQKQAAIQPLLRSATDCIARTVATDARFSRTASADLGELIVESMTTCVGPVRAMIDAYDRYFGDGTGEAFFMGPYLDVLPTAVTKWVSDGTQ
jgi:hypothetical protein